MVYYRTIENEGEKQLPKHQRRGRAVEEKVIPLDGGADEAREDDAGGGLHPAIQLRRGRFRQSLIAARPFRGLKHTRKAPELLPCQNGVHPEYGGPLVRAPSGAAGRQPAECLRSGSTHAVHPPNAPNP